MSRQIYAFRVFGDADERWHGKPDALPSGLYETAIFEFEPGLNSSPFAGRTLEMRHGELADDGTPPYLRSFTQVEVDNALQRVLVRGSAAAVLFPGHS